MLLHNGALQEAKLTNLAQAIQTRCGINYTENLDVLATKLHKRLDELTLTYSAYLELLERNESEWDILIQLITINETYFFREEHQLHQLRETILPGFEKADRPLRIWSAACSTGEEPYTLSMLVSSFPGLSQRTEIVATDINKRVLQSAKQGWYPRHSLCFRRTTAEQIQTYFKPDNDGFLVRPDIRERVTFHHANLLSPLQLEVVGEVDIIFCRNVLIYFDAPTIAQLIRHFHRRLKPGGYLFLGHAETLGANHPLFTTCSTPTTFYYQKGGDAPCVNTEC